MDFERRTGFRAKVEIVDEGDFQIQADHFEVYVLTVVLFSTVILITEMCKLSIFWWHYKCHAALEKQILSHTL